MPPLQPGLPIVWDPTVVVFALAQQLRRCGLATGHPPRGLLDELVAPWGCRRMGKTSQFQVPCDCGRQVRRLLLTGRGWGCIRCHAQSTRLETTAARLLFGLRLGLRGRFATTLHHKTVRLLVGGKLAYLGRRRFAVVQAATVVVSYDPRTPERYAWRELGPVGQALGGEVLQVWMEEWVNPAVYAVRCRAELGG